MMLTRRCTIRWWLIAAVCYGLVLVEWRALCAAEPGHPPQVDVIVPGEHWVVPETLTLRARVVTITPPAPTDIHWRWGGEGLGGEVQRGTLATALAVGDWSPAVSVASLVKGRAPARLFLTFTCGARGKRVSLAPLRFEGYSTDIIMEFEFSYQGQVIKRFQEAAPNGGTVGIVIPFFHLAGGKEPSATAFVEALSGLLDYARQRAVYLESLPEATWPVPTRYALVSDLQGYGEGIYYGIRTTNREVVAAELRSLRQLGVNGLWSAPAFLTEMIASGTGASQDLRRVRIAPAMGFPVPRYQPKHPDPEAGCPFAPGVEARTREGVQRALHNLLKLPVEEVWGLTVDEIGAVTDRAAEGKKHLAVCPRDAAAFREYLQNRGVQPADVGKATWEQIQPLDIWSPAVANLDFLSDRSNGLLAYYTGLFHNYATAKLFTPLRDAFAQANAAKRAALADATQHDSPTARQPWLYSFALRGNTFLMRGHSLDFFDFYRHADNAFVYEMSNRDARIWSWDSYLSDVGRMVSAARDLRFGAYVKPHRGAPIQRALSALSRNARMVYWYTYGPDWAKGDSFASSPQALAQVSKGARLIAKAEPVLYGSSWAEPARVALVRPRASELWMRLSGTLPQWAAAWENDKWVYTALTHAHLAVDPLDEVALANDDLSRYRVLYINGPNLTRAAAQRVAAWVQAGGILYTSGWGLVADEANQPLEALHPVLGLQARRQPEMWYRVDLYGATRLESYDDPQRVMAALPEAARVTGDAPFNASLPLRVGREVLDPALGTEVLARFADGGAAVTRHAYGKGWAYVVGFFPGLEYSAPLRSDHFDMARDFEAGRQAFVTAPAMTAVRARVESQQPTVESILLQNDTSGARAVVLLNWTYRVAALKQPPDGGSAATELVPFDNMQVTIHNAGNVTHVTSAALGSALPMERTGDAVIITIPRLAEADVVFLE